MRTAIANRTNEVKEEYAPVERHISAFSSITTLTKILPFEERKILRYLTLIKELVKNSEKDGTHGLKPHSALFKGEWLGNIQVSNSLKTGSKY